MTRILFDWPYVALGAGALGVLALLCAPRRVGAPSRFRDPAWLSCLVLPVYMVHQFEEHGVDLLGVHYAFLGEMCRTIGHPDVATCPADPAFIFAVNVGAVWIAGVTAILWRHRNPMVGACGFGMVLVNGFAHAVPGGIVHRAYNPGLLSGALVFVPLGLYALWRFRRAGVLDNRRTVAAVASGIVLHAVLLAGLLAYGAGLISHAAELVIQTANGFVPLAFGLALGPAAPPASGTSALDPRLAAAADQST